MYILYYSNYNFIINESVVFLAIFYIYICRGFGYMYTVINYSYIIYR